MKPTNKTCKECGKKIKKEDKSVGWITFEKGSSVKEAVFFHFSCFLKWFDKCVNLSAEEKIKKAAPKALGKVLGESPKIAKRISEKLIDNDRGKTEENNLG